VAIPSQTINRLMAKTDGVSYLEIGIRDGATIMRVNANNKIGVDPNPSVGAIELSKTQAFELYKMTSDEFFATSSPLTKIDMAYIDGMHTGVAALRDLLNVVHFLSPNGIILVDDVIPSNAYSSLSVQSHARRLKNRDQIEGAQWQGSVFQIVSFVDCFLQQFDYRVILDLPNPQMVVINRVRRFEPSEFHNIREVISNDYFEFVNALEANRFRLCTQSDLDAWIDGRLL
jgi:hypothetical protein